MKLSKNALTMILLAGLAFILFTKKTATMSLMAFDVSDISGWWKGMSPTSQTITWVVAGILFVTIIVQMWWKESK